MQETKAIRPASELMLLPARAASEGSQIGQARSEAVSRLSRAPLSVETRIPIIRLPRVAWADELS
jgi:hypothetical protein